MNRLISIFVLVSFFVTGQVGIYPVYAQDFVLPAPGVMIHLSPEFDPPILKGIKIHPDNPFRFDFILDKGDSFLSNNTLRDESTKLIKYFLASLTIPEKDLWVNLSPYEKDRIIPNSFGLTEMGRDLLAEDYMLKQITASLIYPEDEIGKKFWKRIYEEASKRFGTTNIPVSTFNKVWVVPQKAVVYENAKAGTAYVVESKLKVMLEEDYLSLERHRAVSPLPPVAANDVASVGSNIVREIVIPQLTREVNENKNFAGLRQVYNSLILAAWYKKKIKDSILDQVYADQNKVAGVKIDDPLEKEKIYKRYLQAFKKGVYNYIKEEADPISQEVVPRRYFSGGVKFGDLAMSAVNELPATVSPSNQDVLEVQVSAFGVNAGLTTPLVNSQSSPSSDLRKFAGKYVYFSGHMHKGTNAWPTADSLFFNFPFLRYKTRKSYINAVEHFLSGEKLLLTGYSEEIGILKKWAESHPRGAIGLEATQGGLKAQLQQIGLVHNKIVTVLRLRKMNTNIAKDVILILYGPVLFSKFFGLVESGIKIYPLEEEAFNAKHDALDVKLRRAVQAFGNSIEEEKSFFNIHDLSSLIKNLTLGTASEAEIQNFDQQLNPRQRELFKPVKEALRELAGIIDERNQRILEIVKNLKEEQLFISYGGLHIAGLQKLAGGNLNVLRDQTTIDEESGVQEADEAMASKAASFKLKLTADDADELYPVLIRRQLERQGAPEKIIEATIKGWELRFIQTLADQAHLYYEHRDSNGLRTINSKFYGSRGVFQKVGETLAEALENNGFYTLDHKSFLSPLLTGFFNMDEYQINELSGRPKFSQTVDLDFGYMPDERLINFLRNNINYVLRKFRQGQIAWPDLGLSRTKQFLLKQNSKITPDVMVEVLSSLTIAFGLPIATSFGISPEWNYLGVKLPYLELLLSVPLSIYVFDKMYNKTEEIFSSKFEEYNEGALVDRIRGKTADDKKRDLEDYEASFAFLKEYFGKSDLESSAIEQLEREVKLYLQKLERYYRVGQNGNDAVALNRVWDQMMFEKKMDTGPLMSMRSVIILMLKELSDQNPGSIGILKAQWQDQQSKRDTKWLHSPLYQKVKPVIPADIFLDVLGQVEKMQQLYMDLFYKEFAKERELKSLPKIYTQDEESKSLAAFREDINNDYKYLDELYSAIGGEGHTAEERKDGITSRFFIGAYSRLRQIGDSLEKGHDVPLGYTRRLKDNTDHIIKILRKMDARRYGLTIEQVQFMIGKLEEENNKITEMLPKKDDAGGSVDQAMKAEDLLAPGYHESVGRDFDKDDIDGIPIDGWLRGKDKFRVKGEELHLVPLTKELLLEKRTEFFKLLTLISATMNFTLERDIVQIADDPGRFDPTLSFAVLNSQGNPVAMGISHPKVYIGRNVELEGTSKPAYFSKLAVDPYFQGTIVASWLLQRRYDNAISKGYSRVYWQSSLYVDTSKPGTERTASYYKKLHAKLLGVREAPLNADNPNMKIHDFYRDLTAGIRVVGRLFVREYLQQRAVENVTNRDVLILVLRLLNKMLPVESDEFKKSPLHQDVLKVFGTDDENIQSLVKHKIRSGKLKGIVEQRLKDLKKGGSARSADRAMTTTGQPVLHHYTRVPAASVEARDLFAKIVQQSEGARKAYMRGFINDIVQSHPKIRLIFGNIDKFWRHFKDVTQNRVAHEDFLRDEAGDYWILKKSTTWNGSAKNIRKRESLAYLLAKGKANFTETRQLTPEEAGNLGIWKSANDYYLIRVVTGSNINKILPHLEKSQAYSSLFVAHILLRKDDTHLWNLAFTNRGVPVSVDQDQTNMYELFPPTGEYFKEFVLSYFLHNDLLRPVMAFIEPRNLSPFWLYKEGKIELRSDREFLEDTHMGMAYVRNQQLNKEHIIQSIKAFKSIGNVRALAQDAGYTGQDLEDVVNYIETNKKSLGTDVEYVWRLLTGENAGFDKLDHTDAAMISQNDLGRKGFKKGGIDLTRANMNLQTQSSGGEIKFHLDPAQLAQLQNAPGFVPVIINIQPMINLRRFLGLNIQQSAPR